MPNHPPAPNTTARSRRTYWEPWHNLRHYLREAILAGMYLHRNAPQIDESHNVNQHFPLSIQPDSRLRLRYIIRYKGEVMNKRVLQFCEKYIPDTSIVNAETKGTLVRAAYIGVPAHSFPRIVPPTVEPVLNMDNLIRWMMVPLLAAERIMTLVWPEETKGYACMTVSREKLSRLATDRDIGLCRPIWWQKMRSQGQDEDDDENFESTCKLVVLSVLPWVLKPSDMQEFVRQGPFPIVEDPLAPPTYTRPQKVWAKICEHCMAKKCQFFIVSVYQGWVFGTFTDGFTKAVISHVIRYTDRNPSVMQWIVYWMASAIKLEGSYARTPRHHENTDFRDPYKVTEVFQFTPKPTTNEEWLEAFGSWEPAAGKFGTVAGFDNTWVTSYIKDEDE
ncbi:hypothetical protein M422DRAFT_45172 [Sphaerobolus stellatus SS14]|nr:hypothetical protein M422DRAFT_45172 [Sphaerobolus stellatus SS14]